MIVSLCIPSMNRTHDLRRSLPQTIKAASASPPVEIVVLDYNSRDGLGDWLWQQHRLQVTYTRYEERDHYHLAHAYNLAVKESAGEIVVVMGADALLDEGYIPAIRELFDQGAVWARGRHYKGIIAIRRSEFLDAGGYDERFEFYGGEDKELEDRLIRRGNVPAIVPDGLISVIRTPNSRKLINYRLPLSKREMMTTGSLVRAENARNQLLVANEGQEWGAWS